MFKLNSYSEPRKAKSDFKRITQFSIRITICFFLAIFFTTSVHAQSVTLKSGQVFDGDIIERTSRTLTMESNGRRINIPLKQIKSFSSDFELESVPLKGGDESPEAKNAAIEYYKENGPEVNRFYRKIQDYLNTQQFDKLEELAATLRRDKPYFLSGDNQLHGFYVGLSWNVDWDSTLESDQYLNLLKTWLQKYPRSVSAHIALAAGYKDLAWRYRGGGYVQEVMDNSKEKFKKALETSLDYLKKAQSIDVDDPHLYATWITVGLGLGLDVNDLKEYLYKAMDIDPAYWETYKRFAIGLLPRWGTPSGILEDFFFSLRSRIDDDRLKEEMYAVVVDSVREYVGSQEFLKFNFSARRVKIGFEYLLEEFQYSFHYLNSYAWLLCVYEDRTRAQVLFKTLGNYWNETSESIWQNRAVFNRWRRWALYGGDLPGVTALHIAVKKNNFDEVVRLVKQKEDLNARNTQGDTPLMAALEASNMNLALLLLKAGTDIRIKNYEGKTALHYAASRGLLEAVEVLLEQGASLREGTKDEQLNPFHLAVYNGFLDIVRKMYDYEPSILNSVTRDGNTPLHIAVAERRLNILLWLLQQKGVAIDAINKEGNTALHLAASRGNLDMAQALITHGANINAVNKLGSTPLNLAEYDNQKVMIQFLSDKGAITNKDSLSRQAYQIYLQNKEGAIRYYNQGYIKEAQSLFQKALEYNPRSEEVYYYLSLIELNDARNYARALDLARKAISLNARYSDAYFVAGRALFLMDKRPEALEYFRNILRLEPASKRSKDLKHQYPELR